MTYPIIAFLDTDGATRLLALEVNDLARVIARDPRREQWPDLTPRELATLMLKEAYQIVVDKFNACTTADDAV